MNSQPPFAEQQKRLVVVTTITSWDEVPRIRHQVTRQLARFFNVLYVEVPFRDVGGRGGIRMLDGGKIAVYRPRPLPSMFARLRAHVPILHRLYGAYVARDVVNKITQLGYERAVLVNFQFNFPAIMRAGIFTAKLYICNDEIPGRFNDKRIHRRLGLLERKVAESADLCIAVSEQLVGKLSAFSDRVSLLRPGHEFSITDDDLHAHHFRPRVAPIRTCYMGYINHRLRFDWLRELLGSRDISLTLIGPVEATAELDTFLNFENFRVHPPLVGDDLKQALKSHDVLLMPYDARQPGVQAASAPNKLFQYLACGRPIVISDMEQFITLPDYMVYRASDARSFVSAVIRAFEGDSVEAMQGRVAYARENSWDRRGDMLFEMIESVAGLETVDETSTH